MDDAIYVAATAMSAVQRMLDDSAHNAVNADTPGYQRHQVVAQSFGSFLEDAENREHLVGAREAISFQQGDLRQSDSPHAVALEGDGFLSVLDGGGNRYLTRNGDLTINSAGEIVTRAGYPVLGEAGGPLTLEKIGGHVVVERDGTVVQSGQTIGRMKVIELSPQDRARLAPVGETLFKIPEGAAELPPTNTTVHHGYLEMPRYTAPMSLVAMITANKNYEAVQRVIRTLNDTKEQMIRSMA